MTVAGEGCKLLLAKLAPELRCYSKASTRPTHASMHASMFTDLSVLAYYLQAPTSEQ